MRRPTLRLAAWSVLACVLLVGCDDDSGPQIETAEVTSGEVVQTVAAPADIEPAATATVRATVTGEVAEILVEDGARVDAGQQLLRLRSEDLNAQVDQAAAAVDAADELATSTAASGVDVGPAIGGVRAQLEGVLPPLLDALRTQVSATSTALGGAIEAVEDASTARDEAVSRAEQALDDLDAPLDGGELDKELGDDVQLDEEQLEVIREELDAALGDVRDVLDPVAPDGQGSAEVIVVLEDARQGAQEAEAELAATERALEETSAELLSLERRLSEQAAEAQAAQTAAVRAQREQATQALEIAEQQLDALRVVAPISGVVELAQADEGGGELGGLGSLPEGLGTPDGAEPGRRGPAPSGSQVSGALREGSTVAPGQTVARVYDVSSYSVTAEVDELDIVEVTTDQPVTVLVDAYPGQELTGIVDRVALTPASGTTGGAMYPVEIGLTRIPEEVELRIGLTASVEIEVRRVEAELVVPTSALLRRGEEEVVHVVRDGRAVEVPVTVTAMGEQRAAVEGDVRSGEEVVTTGVELIDDGDEIPS